MLLIGNRFSPRALYSFPLKMPNSAQLSLEITVGLGNLPPRLGERPTAEAGELTGRMGWGANNPLLFSSLSCSPVRSPARPCTSQMGRELHPLVTSDTTGASDSVLHNRTSRWEAVTITHTDERKLQTESHYRWCLGQR